MTARLDGALDYETLCTEGDGGPLGIERSATTCSSCTRAALPACPRASCGASTITGAPVPPVRRRRTDSAEHARRARGERSCRGRGRPPHSLLSAHARHGIVHAIGTLAQGGTILTLTGASFDAKECLEAITRWQATNLAIVGDAFAKPLLAGSKRTATPTT